MVTCFGGIRFSGTEAAVSVQFRRFYGFDYMKPKPVFEAIETKPSSDMVSLLNRNFTHVTPTYLFTIYLPFAWTGVG